MTNSWFSEGLEEGVTLCAFDGEKKIFTSKAKWILPLFELEDFLKNSKNKVLSLYVHDKAIGLAAAALMVYLGVEKVHTNLASELAISFLANHQYNRRNKIDFTYETKVSHLLCETEQVLQGRTDIDEMVGILRKRASR